jgi:hypothetical protein
VLALLQFSAAQHLQAHPGGGERESEVSQSGREGENEREKEKKKEKELHGALQKYVLLLPPLLLPLLPLLLHARQWLRPKKPLFDLVFVAYEAATAHYPEAAAGERPAQDERALAGEMRVSELMSLVGQYPFSHPAYLPLPFPA